MSMTLHSCSSRSRKEQNKEERQIKNGSDVHSGSREKRRHNYNRQSSRHYDIGEQEFYSYTKKFKYLGSIFTSSLKDDDNIKRRISQACSAFAQAKKLLCNRKLQVITRTWFYEATVVNLLLWGCESWALTKEQKRKLEVCHHLSLKRTAGITIFDVKEKHITNKQVRERLGNCLLWI